jgi:hypothetical protein
MTMEETNVLRIFEKKIVKNICGFIKEESWRIRTNKGIMDRYCKIYKNSLTNMVWPC